MPTFLKILVIVTILAVTLNGCSSGSDSGSSSDAQFTGDCSLKVTNGAQCGGGAGPVVLVKIFDRGGSELGICTGALLTTTSVLTAGHCFREVPAARAEIVVSNQSSQSASFSVHPKYRFIENDASPYDAAIVHLQTPITTGTLPLLLSEGISSGDDVTIIGYGQDENGNSAIDSNPANSLHQGKMVIDNVQSGFFFSNFSSDSSSICLGDSGGPAIRLNRAGQAGIVGIANAVGGESLADITQCLNGTALFTDIQSGSVRDFITSEVPGVGVN